MSRVQEANRNEHYGRGIALFDHGLYAEAIMEFERVLEAVTEDVAPERRLASFYIGEAYTNLGLSHMSMNMHHQAEEELKFALALHPEYADLWFSLALVCYKQGKYAESESHCAKALSINPRFARALLYSGLSRIWQGNEGGLAFVAQAVSIERAYNDSRYADAMAMYNSGETEDACKLLEEIAETDTDQVGYLLEKGLQQIKHKEYSEAVDTFSEAVALCPHYADLRHNLGFCYLEMGMPELAMEQFARSLEINPSFVSARVNLAMAHQRAQRVDLAVSELENVLRLDPHNEAAGRWIRVLRDDES